MAPFWFEGRLSALVRIMGCWMASLMCPLLMIWQFGSEAVCTHLAQGFLTEQPLCQS